MIIVNEAYKFCPRCRRCLPRTHRNFYFNGEKVSWCRRCKRQGSAEYRRQMTPEQRQRLREQSRVSRAKNRRLQPEREQAWQAANWRRVKADAERYVRWRQDRRIDYYLRTGGEATISGRGGAVGAYRQRLIESERLDPEPFRAWLTQTYGDLTPLAMTRRLAIDVRTLTNILDGAYSTVSLLVVDRVLTRLGRPDLLNDLYPIHE